MRRSSKARTRARSRSRAALGELNFDGQGYVTSFALPNLFFHASMAYAILRASGVPIGKADWLGDVGR